VILVHCQDYAIFKKPADSSGNFKQSWKVCRLEQSLAISIRFAVLFKELWHFQNGSKGI